MEQDYQIKLYFFGEGVGRVLTITQVLKLAELIMDKTPKNINVAVDAVAKYFKVPATHIREEYRTLTIDDFVGNVRPDGHFAEDLDLDVFKTYVDQNSYFIRKFTSLPTDEKLLLCEFIEHASILYKLSSYGNDLFVLLGDQIRAVISVFVRNLFQTDDPRNIQNQLLQMQKFNSIELEELKDILIDVIDKVSIKELATNKDRINSKLADDFYHQIVVANTKKV